MLINNKIDRVRFSLIGFLLTVPVMVFAGSTKGPSGAHLISNTSVQETLKKRCTNPDIAENIEHSYCRGKLPTVDRNSGLNPYLHYVCQITGTLRESDKTYRMVGTRYIVVPGKTHFLPYSEESSLSMRRSVLFGLFSSSSVKYRTYESGYRVYQEPDRYYSEPYEYNDYVTYCQLNVEVKVYGYNPLKREKLSDESKFVTYATSDDLPLTLVPAAMSSDESSENSDPYSDLQKSIQQNDWSYMAKSPQEQTQMSCGTAKASLPVSNGLKKFLQCRVSEDGSTFKIIGPWPY